MRKPHQLYAKQLREVYEAIALNEEGEAESITLRGQTWSTLEELYRLADLVRLDAAIAAIEEGAQTYTILDHTFARAQYKDLYDRRDVLVRRMAATARGGIRTRNAVPIV